MVDILTSQCILTNFRTGSTSFIKRVAANYQLENQWEFFGADPAFADIARNPDQVKFTERWPYIVNSGNVVFKVMGNQLGWNLDYVEEIYDKCGFYYLYRRDFLEQAKSWCAWLVAKDWDHHYGIEKTYKIDVTQEFFDAQTQILVDNYRFMLDAYARFPGVKVCYEDLFPDDAKRYNRTNEWVTEPKLNVSFDTTLLDKM